MRAEDDETLVRSLDAGRADLKDGILATRELHELLADDDRLANLREATDVLTHDGTDLSDVGRQALELGREILRQRTFANRFAELRGAVATIRAEREEVWEAARDRLQAAVADIREQIGPLLDQLTEAQRVEFEARLDEGAVPPSASLGTGPRIEAMGARAAQLPGLVDDVRAEIGRGQGKTVRRVAVRDLFSEPVRDEENLEALLKRIREAAEEALKDDEYFLLT
jgi:hypothetical protein